MKRDPLTLPLVPDLKPQGLERPERHVDLTVNDGRRGSEVRGVVVAPRRRDCSAEMGVILQSGAASAVFVCGVMATSEPPLT